MDDMFLTSQLKAGVPLPSLEPRGRFLFERLGQEPKKVILLVWLLSLLHLSPAEDPQRQTQGDIRPSVLL